MNGLILMTAMPPTKGHSFLINYAYNYLKSYKFNLEVIINTRKHEPIDAYAKHVVFFYTFRDYENIKFHSYTKDVIQEPSDHPDFWNIWKDLILKTVENKIDFVFASEPYGLKVAEVLGAKFIPVNLNRDILPISATEIRKNPLKNFEWLLPEFQTYIRKKVTIFGPESVGKTTLSKALAKEINGHWAPEWAREYLELVGPEITEEKMSDIVLGQKTLQKTIMTLEDKPFIIQDTDLFSTLGYYNLWKNIIPSKCEFEAKSYQSDLYILPNDKIPFTPDPLRYGVDKRETDNDFWINILKTYSLKYYVLQSWSPEAQLKEAAQYCRNYFNQNVNWNFER